jgi:hypothetical protein
MGQFMTMDPVPTEHDEQGNRRSALRRITVALMALAWGACRPAETAHAMRNTFGQVDWKYKMQSLDM